METKTNSGSMGVQLEALTALLVSALLRSQLLALVTVKALGYGGSSVYLLNGAGRGRFSAVNDLYGLSSPNNKAFIQDVDAQRNSEAADAEGDGDNEQDGDEDDGDGDGDGGFGEGEEELSSEDGGDFGKNSNSNNKSNSKKETEGETGI
ncbi:hypothetical protein F8388_020448 [Cannabis sativa]|uniref:Uncharacterized protein n=1 Tax=Cannabis sativa TaxID=3483 RepID=A0A7J6E0E9_CANSA|nr:hypothetical protein F8388_020448 [Cannabis sativa]